MQDVCYTVRARKLPDYDVIVVGGGLAGAAAALRSSLAGAKTLLIESGGELGGDITKGIVPQLLDPDGKGGTVKELYAFLNEGHHTSPRRGARYGEGGEKRPGTVVDLEYVKYYLTKRLYVAGAEVLYHATLTDATVANGRISSLLLATECGAYTASASVYIDATGNGALAALCGCSYECGHPESGHPQPASFAMLATGVDVAAVTETNEDKASLKAEVEACGVAVSGEGISVIPAAQDGVTLLTYNNQYDVFPDDAIALSRATAEGRMEQMEVFDALRRRVPAFRNAEALTTSSHIGIREGRRIRGEYVLTVEDVLSGRRFDDGICLVKFAIDVHRISNDDRTDHAAGRKTLPYHIPYRALLPVGASNLLLAGRCISGDFYAHASYRVAGNVLATGDAAGYAAALCAKEKILPHGVDGRRVRAYMKALGYEL